MRIVKYFKKDDGNGNSIFQWKNKFATVRSQYYEDAVIRVYCSDQKRN